MNARRDGKQNPVAFRCVLLRRGNRRVQWRLLGNLGEQHASGFGATVSEARAAATEERLRLMAAQGFPVPGGAP